MLSNESLLFALNSGCLNSQALDHQLWLSKKKKKGESLSQQSPTYPGSIWRLAAFLVVVPNFVKIILVQLTHETGKVAVLEMLGQDGFGKAFVLCWDVRLGFFGRGYCGWACQFPLVPTSSTTKLSPSSPHLTTDEYVGSSSILTLLSAHSFPTSR